jgi:hypothetical protein
MLYILKEGFLMANKWRTLLRFSGLAFILAGTFAKLPSHWPLVIGFLGLGMFLAAGGFG